MLERLSFRELVRYFFSGIVMLYGIAANTGLTIRAVVGWFRANAWATTFSPAAILAVLTMLIGYVTYLLYRTLIYNSAIISIKGLLAGRVKGRRMLYGYRALIQDEMHGRPQDPRNNAGC